MPHLAGFELLFEQGDDISDALSHRTKTCVLLALSLREDDDTHGYSVTGVGHQPQSGEARESIPRRTGRSWALFL